MPINNDVFLLTRSSRSVTQVSNKFRRMLKISTHTLLAERDSCCTLSTQDRSEFLLTRSSRSVTWHDGYMRSSFDISTHTLLAERDRICMTPKEIVFISTHTLLAERDVLKHTESPAMLIISTHTLLAERDEFKPLKRMKLVKFLLTRSSRSVTRTSDKGRLLTRFLLTRSSRSVTM